MQITYKKNDGTIFQRYRKTSLPYKIGEETSMGWKVLNIEYEYQNNYYSESEYNKIMYEIKQNIIRKNQIINNLKNEIKKFLYYFIAIIILNLLKLLLGI